MTHDAAIAQLAHPRGCACVRLGPRLNAQMGAAPLAPCAHPPGEPPAPTRHKRHPLATAAQVSTVQEDTL